MPRTLGRSDAATDVRAFQGPSKEGPSTESQRKRVVATAKRSIGKRKELPCGRYVATKKIGSGGFGEVYVGKPSKQGDDDGSAVAIKRYRLEIERRAEARRRACATPRAGISPTAIREIANLRAIGNHPNVVALRDVGFAGERPFAVLELYPTDLLEAAKKLDFGTRSRLARSVATQLCRALAHLDSLGIVHRDVKLENVLCRQELVAENDRESLNLHVALCDLGSSRYVREDPDGGLRTAISPTEGGTESPEEGGARSKRRSRRISDDACLTVLAPEMRTERVCDHLSDVFLMAVCVFEFVALRTLSEAELDDRVRLARVCGVPELEECFHVDPNRRPRAGEVLAKLGQSALPSSTTTSKPFGGVPTPAEEVCNEPVFRTICRAATLDLEMDVGNRAISEDALMKIVHAAARHDRNRTREPELTVAASLSLICKYVGGGVEEKRLRVVGNLLEMSGGKGFAGLSPWTRLTSVEWAVFAAIDFDLRSYCSE